MKKAFLICLLVCIVSTFYAQDPAFLNSNQSLIYLNPSFAGSNGGIRNQFSYRNQWPELSGSLRTSLNSSDIYIKPLRAGIALSLMHDDVANGMVKANVISLTYAQYFSLLDNNLKIIPSFQAAYAERNLDVSHLYFFEVYDPRYGTMWNFSQAPATSRSYFDVSAGLLVSYKDKLYVGTSLFHLNQPDIGFFGSYRIPYKLNLHASYNFKLSEKTNLQAFCLFDSQNNFWTNRIALNLISFNHLITGIGYGIYDYGMVNAGYRNNYFSVVLGYDISLSKLAGNKIGSWEFHASFNLRNKELRKQLTSFESW